MLGMIDAKSARTCIRRLVTPSLFIILPLITLFLLLLITAPARLSAASSEYDYYFPWYDNNAAWGMNGDWILISNRGTGNADVSIEVVGKTVALFDAAHDTALAPGVHVEWHSPTTLTNGPVKVTSTNGEPLNVSQRVLYKDSFQEINSVPGMGLESDYLFTWYDNIAAWGMNRDWICAANTGDKPTMINIYVGDVTDSATPVAALGPLAPGQHIEWQSPARLANGPVRVASPSGEPFLAGQRSLFKDSFAEVPGVAASKLGAGAVFPWYDKQSTGMNGDWVLVANKDDFNPVRVQISIGGEIMNDPQNPGNNFFVIAPRGRITPQFPGRMGGPVYVTCQDCNQGEKLIVSQRTIFKDSFHEEDGILLEPAGTFGSSTWTYPIPVPGPGQTIPWQPSNDIGADAWFNWYDSKPADNMAGDWILIANLGGTPADANITIGGTSMINPATGNTHFPIGAGSIITPHFANLMKGPVFVGCFNCTSGQLLLTSQRVIYKNSFNELAGTP